MTNDELITLANTVEILEHGSKQFETSASLHETLNPRP